MKKISILPVFLIIAIFSCLPVMSQQVKERSLLWKISGNGLAAPSYLFGTMHVKNKKAFYFSDSLYQFIEKAEGFAMELHPDSMGQVMTAILEGRINFDEPDIDYKQLEKDFDKIVKKLNKNNPVNKKTTKEKMGFLVEKLMQEKEVKDSSMQTFMDAFLYSLARQQNKKIFGLEQVDDQLNAYGYLTKGLRVNQLMENIDKISFQNDVSPIHAYYYREQLDSIRHFYSTYFSDSSLKGFLYDRNIVMAEQMDSLMHLHTMFTAVGAGHLPGEKGVISLLRKMGYRVEPVTSANKLFAGNFIDKAFQEKWIPYSNTILGYKYEAPGNITIQPGANGGQAEFCIDLTGGMIFMTVSGRLKSEDKKKGMDSVFLTQHEAMIERINGYPLSKKDTVINGMKGYAVLVGSMSNGYSKMFHLYDAQNFYILVVTAEKKDQLLEQKINRFVSSFERILLPAAEWKLFKAEKEGFAVQFPSTPKIEVPKGFKSEFTTLNGHTVFDAGTGSTYSIFTYKTIPGKDLSSAPAFFNTYIANIKEATEGATIIEKDTLINGFPGKTFNSRMDNGEVIKGILLRRKNTGYFITVEYDEMESSEVNAGRFLTSFSLLSFPEPIWKKAMSPENDFSVIVPGNLTKEEPDTLAYNYDKGVIKFYAADPLAATNYYIEATELNKYYWAENADSVLNYWKTRISRLYNDSVITYRAVSNNNLEGRELVVFNIYDKSTIRYRYFLNGTKIYTLSTEIHLSGTESAGEDQFFTSFALAKPAVSSEIFTRSPRQLFTDLQLTDSAIFRQAFEALDEVAFEKKQLDLLLEKTLLDYPKYDNMYQTVTDKLWQKINKLAQTDEEARKKITDFVIARYSDPGKLVAEQRYQMLNALAENKTTASFQLLGTLLHKDRPVGPVGNLFYTLADSLKLTKTLFPGMLKFISDTTMGLNVISLTKQLLDSNIIDMTMLEPARQDIMALANNQLKSLVKLGADDYDYDYEVTELVSLLGYFKIPATDELVKKFLKVKIAVIKFEALITLAKNGQTAFPAEIKQLAINLKYRAMLFRELQRLNKESVFPADQRTQQEMAKGYIFFNGDEDDEMDPEGVDFIFIKKKEIMYKGVKKRFLLYRVVYGGSQEHAGNPKDEEAYSYLGVSGPFDMDARNPLISEKDDISGIYYSAEFDGEKVDDFFAKYMSWFLKNE